MKTGILGLSRRYLAFRRLCKPRHGFGIHSPFVFELYTQAIDPDAKEPAFLPIERYRQSLKRCAQRIDLVGADGCSQATSEVRKIARKAAIPPHLGRLLFRLCRYMQPQSIVELGTSLGISTLYMAAATPDVPLHTIEVNADVQQIAQNQFDTMGCGNVYTHCGTFAEHLPSLLQHLPSVGLAFVDGHHQGEAMLRYVEAMLPHITPSSMLVLDDIRWSDDMEAAWHVLCADPRVSLSIDLFRCGILLFRQGVAKQHFNLRFGPY